MAVIQIKYSVTPGHVPTGLQLGELAINLPDNILYFVLQDGTTLDSFNFNSPQIVTMGGSDNSVSAANTAFVQGVLAAQKSLIMGVPPTSLNSLQKLAAAINNDPNYSASVTTQINNAVGTLSTGAVRFDTAQTLTGIQQTQAQTNIGIASALRFDIAQTLTSGQQAQVQANIGPIDGGTF